MQLTLRPAELPRLRLTDSRGVSTTRCVSLIDLLHLIDESTTLEQLKKEGIHRSTVPELPPDTLLVDALESPSSRAVVITGVVRAANQAFVLERQTKAWIIPMPDVVYTAMYDPVNTRLYDLDIALARPLGTPEAPAAITPQTKLYTWPFSNVYTHGTGTRVCWYTMQKVRFELKNIERGAIYAFYSVPNNPDLYGRGISQNSEHQSLSDFLQAVIDNGGLDEKWLHPHKETVGAMHNRVASSWNS